MRNWYLIGYDIRDEKRLRCTAKKLEGYGTRIQFSVFRCFLSERSLERLRWELSTILAKEDDLFIVELCSRCVSKIRFKGTEKKIWSQERPDFVVL